MNIVKNFNKQPSNQQLRQTILFADLIGMKRTFMHNNRVYDGAEQMNL